MNTLRFVITLRTFLADQSRRALLRRPIFSLLRIRSEPDHAALTLTEAMVVGTVLLLASGVGFLAGDATLGGYAGSGTVWAAYRCAARKRSVFRWSGSDVILTLVAVGSAVAAILISVRFGFCYGQCSALVTRPTVADVALALVFAPLAETWFAQGCVYDAVRSLVPRYRSLLAVISSSAVFVLMHGTLTLELIVSALVLGCLRRATQRLGTVIAAHALINAAVFIVAFLL